VVCAALAGFVAATAYAGQDADGDGIPDAKDACPKVAETANGYADDDGCPDALAHFVVHVVDASRAPVPGALVSIDGLPAGHAGADGVFEQKGRIPDQILSVGVRGPKGQGMTVQPVRLVQGDQDYTLALHATIAAKALATLTVQVQDADGFPVSGAKVRVGGEEAGTTDEQGRVVLDGQTPGKALQITVPSPGGVWEAGQAEITPQKGAQQVSVALARSPDAARQPPILTLVAVDEQRAPIAAGTVVVDGLEQGKTGPDGVFEFSGRPAGTDLVVGVTSADGTLNALERVTLAGGPQRARLVAKNEPPPPELA